MSLSTEDKRVIVGLYVYEISQSLRVGQKDANLYASISEVSNTIIY